MTDVNDTLINTQKIEGEDENSTPSEIETRQLAEQIDIHKSEVLHTSIAENSNLLASALEYIEDNPTEFSLETSFIYYLYDLILESETSRYNDPEIFDEEGFENNQNFEEEPRAENPVYPRAQQLVTTLQPGELGQTSDHISDQNYFDLKKRAVAKEKYAIEGFDDVVFTDGKVDQNFINATLSGTPITYEDLLRLKEIGSFSRESYFENYALPCALLLVRVLKERGLPNEYFKVIFSMALSTMNTESGCGSNIITSNKNSSALGLGQFLTSTAINTFAKLPERERQQYQDLISATDQQMPTRIRARLLGSATFNVRLTVSFIMELFNKIKDKPGTNTSNVASRMYMAYNSGLSNVDFFLEFYEKFPLPATGITPEAEAFLEANKHRVKGSALTRAAIVKSRLPLGRRAPWFHTQGRFNQIFQGALGVETEASFR